MREIKFRAMMDKPHFGHDSVWVYCRGIPSSSWSSHNGTYYGEIKDETVGEFTGLKDKNGKEIYEGDILKTSTGNNTVIWDEKDGMWGFDDRHPLFFADIKQREVIGNIYENPELLDKEVIMTRPELIAKRRG